MEFDAVILGVVLGFAILANRFVDMLVTPLFDKNGWDKFYLMYVAWGFASAFVAATQLNLFDAYIPNKIIGLVLTAIVAGGGANLLHDVSDKK
jgi:hypothetical protein